MVWRGLLRWTGRVAVAICAVVLVNFAVAVILNSMPRDDVAADSNSFQYYACDNGVHVDVVLPVIGGGRDWRRIFLPAHFPTDIREMPYVSLGWGAEGFFATTPHWRDIRPLPVFKALFWLDRSVLHVSYHGDPSSLPHCQMLSTGPTGQAQLFAFIDQTLVWHEGRAQNLSIPGYGTADLFYAAQGRYSLFRTCNIWSADALHAAGQSVGLWSPFSFQLMGWLE